VASLWVVLTAEPGNGWFHRHVLSWSGDIHIRGLVNDLKEYVAVFAFGIGLAFGFSFDTTGPRRREVVPDRDVAVTDRRDTVVDRTAADEPLTAERDGSPAPSRGFFGRRNREPVTSDGRPVDETTTTTRTSDGT
jgi:hypothetical protein